MKTVQWIYYCKPVGAYSHAYDDRGSFESEEEAIRWCEKTAKKNHDVPFEYSRICWYREQ